MVVLLVLLRLCLCEENVNVLRGEWELIPLVDGLSAYTKYIPDYIDDISTEHSSTMDLFLFEPDHEIGWVSSIRGHNIDGEIQSITGSKHIKAKVARFNSDPYPDLLTLPSDGQSILLFTNQVRENIELRKKDVSSDQQTSSNYIDWPISKVFSVEKHSKIVDFTVLDINHDGISDLLVALDHKTSYSLLEIIFSNNDLLLYRTSEILFENNGISEILGIHNVYNLAHSNVVYLSSNRTLTIVENKDPVYSIRALHPEPLDGPLLRYYFLDLNGDG